MKIGVYGSSFDPITNVHLWTASTICHRKRLDHVIFLPSSSKRRDKDLHISDKHRVKMIEMAIRDNPKFELNTYELTASIGKFHTYFTMEHLSKEYLNAELYFIMGADILADIADGKWAYSEELVKNHKFIVMARDGIDMLATIARSSMLRNYDHDGRFELVDKGLSMEISSTYIREEFYRGGEPRYLLPDECYHYIKENNLYRESY